MNSMLDYDYIGVYKAKVPQKMILEIVEKMLVHDALDNFPVKIRKDYKGRLKDLKEIEIVTFEMKNTSIDDEISLGLFTELLPNTVFINEGNIEDLEAFSHEFIHLLQNKIFEMSAVGEEEKKLLR